MTSNPFFETVYEDNAIVVANKDHGLAVIEERNSNGGTCLKNELRKIYGDIYTVHRLDKGTGGLVVFAKNKQSHRELNAQFSSGLVYKRYCCLTSGIFPAAVTCMLPLSGRPQKGRYKVNFKSGKKAITSFYPVSYKKDKSLVEAEMYSGRTHQIRVHLKSLGHPLLQDFLYNQKTEDRRLTLFCYNLSFVNPYNHMRDIFSVPLSDFMQYHYKI
jgi:RluA family pseudouridine synthase